MSNRDILLDVWNKYRHLVKQNVEFIGEVETALKWISYFVAGRGTRESTYSALSELVYSASNILSLVNDTIIRQSLVDIESTTNGQGTDDDYENVSKSFFIRITLTLIDYLEVFAEISSVKRWGNKGKWLVITVIQICKFALRLFLMFRHHCGILTSPAELPLTVQQRKSISQRLGEKQTSDELDDNNGKSNTKTDQQKIQVTFTLKRSGRILRTLSSAPPVSGRTWKLPIVDLKNTPVTGNLNGENIIGTELSRIQLLGETLHTIRPLVHLLARLAVGSQSWTQWCLAFGLDVASLRLLGDRRQFNPSERGELRFRSIVMLHYLLRSPFYETFTKKRLIETLGGMSNRVPLARFVCGPVMEFLPTWQNLYFYSWGS